MERGKNKKPLGSGIARNRASKNGRTCPMLFYLLIYTNSTAQNFFHCIVKVVCTTFWYKPPKHILWFDRFPQNMIDCSPSLFALPIDSSQAGGDGVLELSELLLLLSLIGGTIYASISLTIQVLEYRK